MEADDAAGLGPFVQAVDVLGNKRELLDSSAPGREHRVGPVRQAARYALSAPVIPCPYQLGVTAECTSRCKLFWSMAAPQAVCASKGGDAARGRDPSAGEDGDTLGRAQPGGQWCEGRVQRHARSYQQHDDETHRHDRCCSMSSSDVRENLTFDPDVRVYPDTDTLCEQLAAELARQVAATPGGSSLALTGGRTATRLYQELGREPVPALWSTVEFFWSDERLVAIDDPASNFRSAHRAWLLPAQVPSSRLHHPDLGNSDAEAVARSYETDLRRHLGADLVLDSILLSLGEDGHVASLFPGHPAATEARRLVVAVVDSPKPPPRRVTMTLPLINRAKRVHLLAVGTAKTAALGATLGGAWDPEQWPAQAIRPTHGHATVWVDRAAAAEVPALRGKG